MPKFFYQVQDYFKPNDGWQLKTEIEFKRQRQIQALWIGIIAFVLPAILYFSNRSADCFRDTISHSYYVPFYGDIFVILTSFVALLLMFYRGQSKPERTLARIAGMSAFIVAIVPTTSSGCEITLVPSRIFLFGEVSELSISAFMPGIGFETIHGLAAGVLFLMLAIFSLFVFTATDNTALSKRNGKTRNKTIRNNIYKITGVIMSVTVVLLAANQFFGFPDCNTGLLVDNAVENSGNCHKNAIGNPSFWDKNNLTFYFEWLALASFGVAWFVKGRGGGFLLLDKNPEQTFSRPWWLKKIP